MTAPAVNISLFNFIMAMGITGLWFYVSSLVNMDARRIRLERQMWSGVMLISGVLGIIAWVYIPNGFAGNIIFLVIVALPTTVYILYRNGKVEPPQRIFTREWFTRRKEIKELASIPLETKIRLYDSGGRPIYIDMDSGDKGLLLRQYNFVQDFFFDVAHRRAAEIDISPQDAQFSSIRFLIDGVATQCPSIPKEQITSIIQFIKLHGGVDPDERKRPQNGKIAMAIGDKPTDIEFVTAGVKGGQKMRLKVSSELVQTNIDTLGMDKRTTKYIEKTLDSPGIIIVSSLPKCGSTSTLYSIISKQDPYVKMITTVESKAAMDLSNVTQNLYGDPSLLNKTLSTSIRHDPNYIMLDQCLDAQTMQLMGEFISEKKQLLLEIKAYDSFAALNKFIRLGGNPDWLRGVLGQCLMRKLCKSCREAFRPSGEMLEKTGLGKANIQKLYRPPTQQQTDSKMEVIECSACGGTGYLGRIGVFEFLDVSNEICQLIQQKVSISQIKSVAKKSGMRTIRENALLLAANGVTSVTEVVRVSKLLAEASQKGRPK